MITWLALQLFLCLWIVRSEIAHLDLLMPHVQPETKDTYLCHSVKMDLDRETYITGFIPKADMEIVHHATVLRCEVPGTQELVWQCGNYQSTNVFTKARPCQSVQDPMFFWARDAEGITLPRDVAFSVGGQTGMTYLILQVHYNNVTLFNPPYNLTDNSGITLVTQTNKPSYQAGVMMFTSYLSLNPQSTVYVESALTYFEDIIFWPFAYRVHTHVLGKVVSGYRIRDGKWTEIGRRDPLKPQAFVNTSSNMTVEQGDILAVRCTIVNNFDYVVRYGPRNTDEMCAFFIMYYTENNKKLKETVFRFTKADRAWEDFPNKDIALQNMPDTVSTVPGTTTSLEQTRRDKKKEEPEK